MSDQAEGLRELMKGMPPEVLTAKMTKLPDEIDLADRALAVRQCALEMYRQSNELLVQAEALKNRAVFMLKLLEEALERKGKKT